MSAKTFPLVRGRRMRVTRLDGCGRPVYGPCSQVVTEGFISAALSAVINEGEAITVVTASGKTCVNDQPEPEFQGYTAELTFCDVDPSLFALITGQEQVEDANGEVVGFRMSSDSKAGSGFALEVWAGVPGVACDPNAGAQVGEPSGYLLLPFLKGGVLGDFTIENAAVNFAITGAATKGGSAWGLGPYDVQFDAAGNPGPLTKPIGAGDHLHVQYTEVPPPTATDGCAPLIDPALAAAYTIVSASPGAVNPGDTSVILDVKNASGNALTGAALAAAPVDVDWGDGDVETISDPLDFAHDYAGAGTYVITLTQGSKVIHESVTLS